jgi:predicted amidohydrolase
MPTIRVTGVQMQVAPKKSENLPRILQHIKECSSDFIVFPEMSLTGYNNDFSDPRTRESWREVAAACRQYYAGAIVGTGCRDNGHTFIQVRIYDEHGERIGTQEKLVPTESDRKWCRPGEELRVFKHKGVTFGCLIGNDLWMAPGCGPYPDPRLTYQLGQKGAKVIFHSANSGGDPFYAQYHEANLRTRAKESGVYIVTVNAAVAGGTVNAPTGVVGPDGRWVVQCPLTGEQKFSIDLTVE